MTLIDKALKILENTNDGNDLTPQHLKLLENGVNGFLNDKGAVTLDELYKTVEAGQYKRSAYLGVEFMDRDSEGYVYFKGTEVEHYSSFYAYSEMAKMDLTVLQSHCLFLEQNNIPLNRHFQCDYSMGGEYAEAYGSSQKVKLDALADGKALTFAFVKIESADKFTLPGHPMLHAVSDSKIFREICSYRDMRKADYSVTYYTFGDSSNGCREATPDEAVMLYGTLDYLKAKGLVREEETKSMSLLMNNENTADEILGSENEDEEDCEI